MVAVDSEFGTLITIGADGFERYGAELPGRDACHAANREITEIRPRSVVFIHVRRDGRSRIRLALRTADEEIPCRNQRRQRIDGELDLGDRVLTRLRIV